MAPSCARTGLRILERRHVGAFGQRRCCGDLRQLVRAHADAAEVLANYATRRIVENVTPREAAAILCHLQRLRPSVHDERLQTLVQDVLAQKDNLSLTSLVDVSRVLESMGLHRELEDLSSLVVESASFLSSDVILSFAKTLSLAARRTPGASTEVHAAVFRMLGEHVLESMFDAAPADLAEALLAIAVFCCSRPGRGRGGALLLERPWHPAVFAAAAPALALRAPSLPAPALLKCLRAYELMLLSSPGRGALGRGGPRPGEAPQPLLPGARPEQSLTELPPVLAEALAPRLPQLRGRGVVRALHALASLRRHGLPLGAGGEALRVAAREELRERTGELDARDIGYALEAFGVLSDSGSPLAASSELLRALYEEVQRNVHSLTVDDALRMSRAVVRLAPAPAERPRVLLELLAAEVLRELRSLPPARLCDVVTTFAQLRFNHADFLERLSGAFVKQLPTCEPRHLAAMVYSFTKVRLSDSQVYRAASVHATRSLVGFRTRDLALTLWSFSRAMQRSKSLFMKSQEHLRGQDLSKLSPADTSMLLWSYGHAEVGVDGELLGALVRRVSDGCGGFPTHTLLVTCLAFARLGFAQQPDLYRSVYARLPRLDTARLAFAFFLFSSSGIRDEALLSRFLHECGQRVHDLRGQDLANVVLACSRTATMSDLERHELAPGLKLRILEQLDGLGTTPLLGCFMAGPKLLAFSEPETLQLMSALRPHVPRMGVAELGQCLLAAARVEIVHMPLLSPLYDRIRIHGDLLDPSEVLSCIWAVYLLGFCTGRLKRKLCAALLAHVRRERAPAGALRDVLPALGWLGFWERLPNSLRRSVWRMAGDDLRRCVSEPPPPPEPGAALSKEKAWRLPKLKSMSEHLRLKRLSRAHQLEALKVSAVQRRKQELVEEREADLAEADELGERPPAPTAVDQFIQMVRRL
ncbi:unnamed protein product [Prorocentrum cordatum]|uniref:RNA-editing substrate-binding complex 6 protein domain-containing protein n=1 Tax=Prorocentrum cordatum TaxID=2364126 RepID=A0ABN9V5J7_9DINO|nr:unnamed protein product [Polarella glacialis]